MTTMLEPTKGHMSLARQMRARARRGWYLGTRETLLTYGARAALHAATEPELCVSLLLSRDRMHHSVGWWRNAEYECCWHLSISAKAVTPGCDLGEWNAAGWEQVPRAECAYWAQLIFEGQTDKLWHEPGGTDPRLTVEERRAFATFWHIRMFMDPESLDDRLLPWTGVPFIPKGEVYDLTRWIPGLTPEKVDR